MTRNFPNFFPFSGEPARFLDSRAANERRRFPFYFESARQNLHAGDFFPTQPHFYSAENQEWDGNENDANSAAVEASASGDDGYSRDIITGWSRRRWIMVAGIKLDLI